MDSLVFSVPVTVYQDSTGGKYPNGCTREIDCHVQKITDEAITLDVGDSQCHLYQPGDAWPGGVAPAGMSPIQTVKIKSNHGVLWISPTSYVSLLNTCNDCCTS